MEGSTGSRQIDPGKPWQELTEEERLRFFQGMGLRPEVVFWPGENRFRISLPVNLLAQTVVLLLGSGCPHLSVDVYRASGLAAISAETVSDFYAY